VPGSEYIVNTARSNGAVRHAVVSRGLIVLGKGNATLGLDFGHAQGAIRARSGEHHANAAIAVRFRQRAHEMIDRHGYATRFFARLQLQDVIANRHRGIGRDHIDIIGFNLHAMPHLEDRHGCLLSKQISKHALVLGIEMLDQNKAHSGIGGQMLDEFGDRLNATSGRADGDNNEVAITG